MSTIEYGPINSSDSNIKNGMLLAAQDIIEAGVEEGLVYDALGIGVAKYEDIQGKSFEDHPEEYIGAFSDNALSAILRISNWGPYLQYPYAKKGLEQLTLKLAIKAHADLPGSPMGIVALSADKKIDRERVLTELVRRGVERQNVATDIYAPHHRNDIGRAATSHNGFDRTGRESTFVDLKQGVRINLKQELYLRKGSKTTL